MTKKLKFGRGGKRNRQRRNRMANRNVGRKKMQRINVRLTKLSKEDMLGFPVEMKNLVYDLETNSLDEFCGPEINLSGPWNESIAKEAFLRWEASCETQKVFAEKNGFPVSRFRSWKSKIAA